MAKVNNHQYLSPFSEFELVCTVKPTPCKVSLDNTGFELQIEENLQWKKFSKDY
jgi:hypothetical protein